MPLYDPQNPHPGFGKDPNILNEWGHTYYPKYVYPKGSEPAEGEKPDLSKRVIVNNPKEEFNVTGKKPNLKGFSEKEEVKEEAKPGWK